MIRLAILAAPLVLCGCGAATVPILSMVGGYVVSAAKLDVAVLGYITAKDALPPDCGAGVPLPCVMRAAP